jgi:Ca-activated chloride channel homolog
MTASSFARVVILAAGAFAAAVTAQTPSVLSSRVTLVRVDVAVTRGGRAVQGLTAADFEVLDNGVPQQVAMVDPDAAPLSIHLVFDVSSSVAGAKLTHLIEAANGFLDALGPRDQAGLLTFSHDLRLLTPAGAGPREVREALAHVKPAGATSLFDAFSAALLLPASNDGRAIVMVFSDGADTMSWLPAESVVELARGSAAVAYAVALREAPTQPPPKVTTLSEPPTLKVLRRLAEATGGSVALADSSAQLKRLFLQALREIRGRYLLAYYPERVAADGWHTIDVKLRTKKGEVRFRPGYFAARP